MSIPAGIAGMPLLRFTLLSALGSGVWNAIFVGLGWYLGERWELVERYMAPLSTAVVVIAVFALGLAGGAPPAQPGPAGRGGLIRRLVVGASGRCGSLFGGCDGGR